MNSDEEAITVAQLIEWLKQQDQTLPVYTEDEDYEFPITPKRLDEILIFSPPDRKRS